MYFLFWVFGLPACLRFLKACQVFLIACRMFSEGVADSLRSQVRGNSTVLLYPWLRGSEEHYTMLVPSSDFCQS